MLNTLTTLFAILFVLGTSILAAHKTDLKSKVSFWLSIYLFSFANIILVTQIASLLKQLDNRWLVLTLHIVLFLITILIWKKGKRQVPLINFLKNMVKLPVELVDLLKKHPLYWALGAIIIGATLFNAFIAIKVPPNTNDAMIQHMSRVGYWLQHGSMAVWNTPLVLQTVYPPNAQLNILWTILFGGSDRFAPLIQWFAIPVSALSIYGLSIIIGWSRERSVLSALLWMTLPQIVLQSTSTQNDLVSTGLVAISIYFLYTGFRNLSKPEMIISALGLGLAIGTKQTVFFILPAILVILALFWVNSNREMRRSLFVWAFSAIGFFLLFGSYIYIQNMLTFKTPFGPSEVVSDTMTNEQTGFLRNAALKISRVTYQTFDLTEIPYRDFGADSKSMWVYNQAAQFKSVVGSKVFSWLGYELESGEGIVYYPQNRFSYIPPLQIQEDITWFGPMVFFMIPAMIISLVAAVRKRDKLSVGLALIWLCLFLSINFFKNGWTPNQSRYYVLSVTLTMPLVSSLWVARKKRFFNYLLLFFGMVFMVFTMMMNFAKPLTGSRNIWNKSDAELRGLQSVGIRDSIEKINQALPDDKPIGVVLTGESFDYPLFGTNITHILVPAYPGGQVNDQSWLEANGICNVLIADHAEVEPNETILHLVEDSPGWALYQVADAETCAP